MKSDSSLLGRETVGSSDEEGVIGLLLITAVGEEIKILFPPGEAVRMADALALAAAKVAPGSRLDG